MADLLTEELIDALRRRFAQRWQVDVHGSELMMRPRKPVPGRPQRRTPSPGEIVRRVERVFADLGVPRAPLLPIRWGRDTDLLISAIQGLDPWLKDGVDRVWREGFLPQPVIRLNGKRDEAGRLCDGFLTSFVNVSCIQRIPGIHRHVELIDIWLDALSAVGIHAGRLRITGDLEVWQRATVSGLTLHMSCNGLGFADAVLLWHTADPSHMATDLGSGLERLRWLQSARPWAQTVFGPEAARFDVDVLDAIRTGTLLVMAGVQPGGHGGALRRVVRQIPAKMAASGLGRLVRAQRAHWTEVGMAGPPWPQAAEALEAEVLTSGTGRRLGEQ